MTLHCNEPAICVDLDSRRNYLTFSGVQNIKSMRKRLPKGKNTMSVIAQS